MRLAIVGAGRRGVAHGRVAKDYPGAELVAVCDPNTERAEALAAELGGRAYPDHRRALDAERLDAMYLTSPPTTHTEIALDALGAGCHLMIEKPIALDMDKVAQIGRAAEQAGRLVMVCQQLRYTPGAARAKELLAGRTVGLVHSFLYRQKPDVRGNWKRAWGGGHVVENQIHPIDLSRYVVGEIERVFAQYGEAVYEQSEDWDNWDSYAVTLRYAGGAVGSVGTTYAAFPNIPHNSALDVAAEGIFLRIRWDDLEVFYPDGRTEAVKAEERPTATLGRAFLRAVESGDRSHLRQDYDDAARSLAVCLAANESAQTGNPITLDRMGRKGRMRRMG